MRNEPWSFYKKYAKRYGDWQFTRGVKEFQAAEKRFLTECVEPGSRVIDIGCGPGEHIASILEKKCEITAVDFVEEMIELAKARVGNTVHFICDDIDNLTFPVNHFDYGICYCTLPNQQNYQTVFDKISFYSKALILSVYNWDRRFEAADFYHINGLNPRVDEEQKTIFIQEGLRYIFLSEETVRGMYERNDYLVQVNSHDFGNIYYGTKRTLGT